MKPRQPLLRWPPLRILAVIFVTFLCYLYLTRDTGRSLASNFIFFFGGLFLLSVIWIAFFAQFVLPVRRLPDRIMAFSRLIAYMFGMSGPAVFIENGEVVRRAGEEKRKYPGVVILDTASAAVLRNDVSFTRVVGPGLVFTQAGEYIAGAVDLHRQSRPTPPLGPSEGMDVFAPRRRDESDDEFQKKQERRLETSAWTRDGVEVVPNVLAIFRLERLPSDEDISFGFNPNAAEAWVRAKGGVDLFRLPALLAVNVWREMVQKFTLSELFAPPLGSPSDGETGLETVLRMVRLRLTSFQVEELDKTGKPTGKLARSEEFRILQDCGIRVEGVSIYNLRFRPEVENKLVDDWIATWLQRAQVEHELVDERRASAMVKGQQLALERFARAAVRRFDPAFLALSRPNTADDLLVQMKMTLDRLLRGTLQECILDPRLSQRLNQELNTLTEMINWARLQEP